MSQSFSITVNGRPVRVSEETSVAAAMMLANEPCRVSVRGELRGPLCGMGICFECRVAIDGMAHQRACLVEVRDGMTVITGAGTT